MYLGLFWRLGEKQLMWLNKFKIALAQKDTDSIERLLDEVPNFEDIEDAKKASYLFEEALKLFNTLKDETTSSMKQIKRNIDFINVTSSKPSNTLDIKS